MILNDFKNNIVKIINNSNLTIENIYYVIKDILNEITLEYNAILQQEIAAAAQSNEPAESEDFKTEAVAETKEKEE